MNAGAVTFDPNKKGDSRIVVPPMPSNSNMADYRNHPHSVTRTLPGRTTSSGGPGRYYNTDGIFIYEPRRLRICGKFMENCF